MARPLISSDAIYERALAVVDAEGPAALNARRLAADLGISTRTLYQQVGKRDELVRALVARHFAELKFEFEERETWEATALHWCVTLRRDLCAHPHLTELMSLEDRGAVMRFVDELTGASLREGMPRALAVDCSRVLVNLTLDNVIMEGRAARESAYSNPAAAARRREKTFRTTVGWVLVGVRADARNI